MAKKKIAETVNIRINVGNYQHIELSKYAEKEIEYENKEEMIAKEDKLTEELIENIVRNMRRISEKLGKETNGVSDVEERITKVIPDFMKGAEEPNLAKKKVVQSEAEEKSNEEKKKASSQKASSQEKEIADLVEEDPVKSEKSDADLFSDDGDDLFSDE